MNAQQGTLFITGQMTELLQGLSQSIYTSPVSLFHGGTLGQHFRHILEFYTCLLDGYSTGLVDYSTRKRDVHIAENPALALAILRTINANLQHLDPENPLRVQSEFSEIASQSPAYQSSLGRELQYAFDHAVHHLAIIRMGLETCFPEIEVHAGLGIAPSTLKNRQTVDCNS